MGKRREGMDLYATILEVVKTYHGEARITRMSYGAGMPVDRLRPAVDRLRSLGLLNARVEEERTCYEITLRGHEFLKSYWRLKGFVEALETDDGLPPGISAATRVHRSRPSARAVPAPEGRISTAGRSDPPTGTRRRSRPPGSPPP